VFKYCNYGIASTKVCCHFLECLTYFVVDDLILLFVAFVELLGNVYASFLFMNIILLFILTCMNLLVKSPLGDDLKSPLYGDVSEKPMMEMFNPFSAGTLTSLER
jgi:uncharacterized membrane protein